jgi:hypothetical protein
MRRAPQVLAVAAVLLLAGAGNALACGSSGYTYAGLASTARAHGVSARVTAIGAPVVQNGHVAGWIGVGGPKEGPNGADEWLQVGFSGFAGTDRSSLYYEVTRPGTAPTYREVESDLPVGTVRRLAVLEQSGKPNWWRIWVDGQPVGQPIYLPGSHGAWRPVATAESWGGGQSAVCNGFAYRFDEIAVARQPGGSWQRLAGASRILSSGFRLSQPSAASFVAASGQAVKPVLRPVASATP